MLFARALQAFCEGAASASPAGATAATARAPIAKARPRLSARENLDISPLLSFPPVPGGLRIVTQSAVPRAGNVPA